MNAALQDGTLLVEGECLYVATSGGKVLLAFSLADVRWDDAARGLIVGDTLLRSGQPVRLQGGFSTNTAGLTWVKPPVSGCDTSSIFIAGAIATRP